MKRTVLAMISLCLMTSLSNPEDMTQTTAPTERSSLPNYPHDRAFLAAFALEWDRQAGVILGQDYMVPTDTYRRVVTVDKSELTDALQALNANGPLMNWLATPEVMSRFNDTYQTAVESGSVISFFEHEQALQYWAVSQAIAIGELRAQQDLADLLFCLPPLIRCTPRTSPNGLSE